MSTRSYVGSRNTRLDDATAAALAETFKVLGDPTRVRILDALARAEVPVCDLAELLGLTQSAVSHQLRLLRSMRLVRSCGCCSRVCIAIVWVAVRCSVLPLVHSRPKLAG